MEAAVVTKCATEGCQKNPEPRRSHCERCVRAGFGGPADKSESPIPSTSTVASISTGPGGKSRRWSDDGLRELPRTERATETIPDTRSEKMPAESVGSKKTTDESLSVVERLTATFPKMPERPSSESESSLLGEKENSVSPSSERGTLPAESNTSSASMPAVIEGTPPATSTARLLSSEEAELASLSLVDDVTGRLHLQMKRLTLSPDKVGGTLDPIDTHSERSRAALAIKTAGEMRQMIKLKLEAVKVFRDLE